MSNQPVHIISDTGSESESDGGMQLDSMQLEDLYGSPDGTPMPMSDTRLLHVDGIPMPRPRSEDEFWGLNTSNGSDESVYPIPLPSLVIKLNHELSTISLSLSLSLSFSSEPRESLHLCIYITKIHGTNPTSIPTPSTTNKSTKLTSHPQKGRYHTNAQNPLTTPYNSTDPNRQSASQTAFEKDVRTRSHLRDEKHAALAVLMDNELLVTYALASREVR